MVVVPVPCTNGASNDVSLVYCAVISRSNEKGTSFFTIISNPIFFEYLILFSVLFALNPPTYPNLSEHLNWKRTGIFTAFFSPVEILLTAPKFPSGEIDA